MKKYAFFLTEKAHDDLNSLAEKEKVRILKKLRFYSLSANPLLHAKKLTNFSNGQYRFRIGDYRVIFDLDDKGSIIILIVLTVRHRREAYNL